jgi:hypothetical protein
LKYLCYRIKEVSFSIPERATEIAFTLVTKEGVQLLKMSGDQFESTGHVFRQVSLYLFS